MLTEFDSRTFRNAAGQFLTGVTIVTAVGPDGEKLGLTANSFTSVSLDPPLVLISIDKSLSSYEELMQAEGYAVHILSTEQQELSTLFATRGADKFGSVETRDGLYGAPLLPEAMAVFECKVVERYPGGDHTLLLGHVERLTPGDGTGQPLAYFRGRYAALAE